MAHRRPGPPRETGTELLLIALIILILCFLPTVVKREQESVRSSDNIVESVG